PGRFQRCRRPGRPLSGQPPGHPCPHPSHVLQLPAARRAPAGQPSLRPRLALARLARALLAHLSSCTALLLIDETPRANDLRVLSVCVADAHRALPLAAPCYRPHTLPRPLLKLVRSRLRQVRGCLPAGLTMVLLADRGQCWLLLVDSCQAH